MIVVALMNLFRRKPVAMPAPGTKVNLLDQFGQLKKHDGVVLAPLAGGQVLVEWPKTGMSEAPVNQLAIILG